MIENIVFIFRLIAIAFMAYCLYRLAVLDKKIYSKDK